MSSNINIFVDNINISEISKFVKIVSKCDSRKNFIKLAVKIWRVFISQKNLTAMNFTIFFDIIQGDPKKDYPSRYNSSW